MVWRARDVLLRPDFRERALVVELAELPLPLLRLPRRVEQRHHGARIDGHLGALGDLEEPQCVADFFVAPAVAARHGDAEHVDILRLQQQQDRLEIGARRAEGILVDDDLPLRGSVGDRAQ
jgi:hypothetical protein